MGTSKLRHMHSGHHTQHWANMQYILPSPLPINTHTHTHAHIHNIQCRMLESMYAESCQDDANLHKQEFNSASGAEVNANGLQYIHNLPFNFLLLNRLPAVITCAARVPNMAKLHGNPAI